MKQLHDVPLAGLTTLRLGGPARRLVEPDSAAELIDAAAAADAAAEPLLLIAGGSNLSQLAAELGLAVGERAPLNEVRDAVLALRRGRGMVIDAADPDSVSAGSFFTNPILSVDDFAALEHRVSERLGPESGPPSWNESDGQVKTSAAWLIERAGFGRGYGSGRVGVSNKHTLALINRGAGTTNDLIGLARELRDGVDAAFGVTLAAEPTLIGVAL